MKRTLLSAAACFSAFLVGQLLFLVFSSHTPESPSVVDARSFDSQIQQPAPAATPVATKSDNSEVEFDKLETLLDYVDISESNDLIDLLQTEGIYRESEVVANNGEKWLVLFEQGGEYSLHPATAEVKKKRTQSYVGDEYDVQLSFNRTGVALFAIRSSIGLKRGAVTTLYHRPSQDEIDQRNLPIGSMQTGYKRDFNLNGTWYTLRVSRAMDSSGQKVGVLVLEHEGFKQIIATNYYEPGYGETIGELLWVGDLDRDGKLDLYFDEDNEKGYFRVGLYLSSAAEPGKLVKLAATFGTLGC